MFYFANGSNYFNILNIFIVFIRLFKSGLKIYLLKFEFSENKRICPDTIEKYLK